MGEIADREIEEVTRECLVADSRVDIGEIDVNVRDGVVHLSGKVDSAAERQAILEDIRIVPGVIDTIDQLVLRNYVQRTDAELKEAVKHALARDIAVDAVPVTVEAAEGKVVLRGHVDSYAQKNNAEDVAWWTPGVTDVISHLEVEEDMPADLED